MNAVKRVEAWLDNAEAKLKKKEMNVPTDLVGAVIFLIFGIVMLCVIPGQIKIKKSDVVNGRAFPNLLMILTIVCSAALIIKEVVKIIRKKPLNTTKLNLLVEVKAVILFAFMLVYYFTCQWTGNFAIGSCIFALLMLLFFRCKKWYYYVITLSAAVLIWVAFRYGLGVRF